MSIFQWENGPPEAKFWAKSGQISAAKSEIGGGVASAATYFSEKKQQYLAGTAAINVSDLRRVAKNNRRLAVLATIKKIVAKLF